MKRDDRYLVASGLVTLAIVAYVDSFLENSGATERLLGYLTFAGIFILLESQRLILNLWLQRWTLLLEVVIALVLLFSGTSELMPILFVIWAAQVPRLYPGRTKWLLLVLVNTVILAKAFWARDDISQLITALVFFGFQWFAASSSAVRIHAKEAKDALEAAHIQLKGTQSLLAQKGKAQERLRIARDLHDGIGHKLTALSLKLEHARYTLGEPLQPLVTELKQDVSETLSELRVTVQQVRSSHHLSLAEVVSAVQSILPPSVSITWPENLGVEDVDLGEQLAFCIQEGISNALRHGQATIIDIQQRQGQPSTIFIIDNGYGKNSYHPNNGIKGMNERLAPFGGFATLGTNPNGRGMQLRLDFFVAQAVRQVP